MNQKYRCSNTLNLLKAWVFKNHPVYLHYGITHHCNLACRMCQLTGSAEAELSLEQIHLVAERLRRLGIVYVSIGGGEPLLRADLPSVIKLLLQKGFMVRLLTNGLLAQPQVIEQMAQAGLREVSISLDTLNPQTQAYICDHPDIGEKIIRAIELFSKILPKKGRLLLINTVVSALNIQELPQLHQFAQKQGCFISFVPVEANNLPEFSFSPSDAQAIDNSYAYLLKMKRNRGNTLFNSSLFLHHSRQYLKSGQRTWRCDAGRLYLSLNPQGELSVCHKFNPGINILQPKPGLDLGKLRRLGQQLSADCSGCLRPCWAELSFLFRDRKSLWEMVKVRMRQ